MADADQPEPVFVVPESRVRAQPPRASGVFHILASFLDQLRGDFGDAVFGGGVVCDLFQDLVLGVALRLELTARVGTDMFAA